MIVTVEPEVRRIEARISDVVGGHGHKTNSRSGVELKLCAPDSLFGLGESSPLPGFSPETLTTAIMVLQSLDPFELCLPDDLNGVRPLLESLVTRVPADVPSARFAFEGALLDLLGHHFGVSVATLLSAMLSAPRQVTSRLTLSKLLPISDQSECLTVARRAWSRGYRVFKVKLGPAEELAKVLPTLGALREKFGAELSLRFDPNGCWQPGVLEGALRALLPFEPELVEEPAPVAALLEIPSSPVPLALDESLLDPMALSKLVSHIDALKLKAVVLKPALHGLLRSVDLAIEAQNLGLDVIITHLFDGAVGHATAICLALAVASPHRAQGLAPHPGLLMTPHRRVSGLGLGEVWHENHPGLPLVEVGAC